MESGFGFFIAEGLRHIMDWQAYDHMLFLVALSLGFTFKSWKKLLLLVTAFTFGHCLTLVLCGLEIIKLDQGWIEFLIPLTIGVTALISQLSRANGKQTGSVLNYILVLFFGFVHGAGFSNFFRSMFSGEDGIIVPLLGFNIGVELGQILILSCILSITYIVSRIPKMKLEWWWQLCALFAIIKSVRWAYENYPL